MRWTVLFYAQLSPHMMTVDRQHQTARCCYPEMMNPYLH